MRKPKTYGSGDTFKFTHRLSDGTIIKDEDWPTWCKEHPGSGKAAVKALKIFYEHFLEKEQ